MSKQAVIILIIVFILVPEFWIGAETVSIHSRNKKQSSAKARRKKFHTTPVPDSIKRQSNGINYFSVSDPVPSATYYIDVTNPGHGLTPVINNGPQTDNSAALQGIIDFASGGRKILYFPPGRYLIASDITIKTGMRLLGSRYGISQLETEASRARVTKIGNTLADTSGQIHVDYLFFDGVNLHFGHNDHKKRFIFVSHCVFFSKSSPGQGAKQTVRFVNIANSGSRSSDNALGYSVFLRDEHAFGVATNIQSSHSIKIRNNIYGLDLGRIDWIDTVRMLTDSNWSDLKLKLKYLKTQLHLRDDQGYFKSSIYSGFSNHSLIEKNIFNGSPNSGSHHHDHVVYLKGFDGMEFLENYARGWPSDHSGGIKARNGKELVIARNYIDDTGVLLYTHIKANRGVTIYLGLKNVLVYGNHIVQRTNRGHRTSGISYYEPHFAGQDENLSYSANVFEIIGGSSPPTEDCIFLTNGNQSENHVYTDNVYYGTTQRVRLEAKHGTPSYETGDISSTLLAPYVNTSLPNYNIPTYA